jgi:hypothetical protein
LDNAIIFSSQRNLNELHYTPIEIGEVRRAAEATYILQANIPNRTGSVHSAPPGINGDRPVPEWGMRLGVESAVTINPQVRMEIDKLYHEVRIFVGEPEHPLPAQNTQRRKNFVSMCKEITR